MSGLSFFKYWHATFFVLPSYRLDCSSWERFIFVSSSIWALCMIKIICKHYNPCRNITILSVNWIAKDEVVVNNDEPSLGCRHTPASQFSSRDIRSYDSQNCRLHSSIIILPHVQPSTNYAVTKRLNGLYPIIKFPAFLISIFDDFSCRDWVRSLFVPNNQLLLAG